MAEYGPMLVLGKLTVPSLFTFLVEVLWRAVSCWVDGVAVLA